VVGSLADAGCDVVGVEQEAESSTLERVRGLNVPVIEGDIKDPLVLRKAGVEQARTVVICTDNDLANLQAAIHCRELNPAIRLIMRLFDAELARHVKDVLGVDEAYSASALAAPVFAGAALDLDVNRTFSLGDEVMSIGRLTIHGGGGLEGTAINEVEDRFDCSVVAHERGGRRDWHPANDLLLMADDHLVVVADLPSLNSLARSNEGRNR
jgi:voltage-gated potassium channel